MIRRKGGVTDCRKKLGKSRKEKHKFCYLYVLPCFCKTFYGSVNAGIQKAQIDVTVEAQSQLLIEHLGK